MSEESDLWNRTIIELQYAQVLLKECAEHCRKAIHANQDAVLLLESARKKRVEVKL